MSEKRIELQKLCDPVLAIWYGHLGASRRKLYASGRLVVTPSSTYRVGDMPDIHFAPEQAQNVIITSIVVATAEEFDEL